MDVEINLKISINISSLVYPDSKNMDKLDVEEVARDVKIAALQDLMSFDMPSGKIFIEQYECSWSVADSIIVDGKKRKSSPVTTIGFLKNLPKNEEEE